MLQPCVIKTENPTSIDMHNDKAERCLASKWLSLVLHWWELILKGTHLSVHTKVSQMTMQIRAQVKPKRRKELPAELKDRDCDLSRGSDVRKATTKKKQAALKVPKSRLHNSWTNGELNNPDSSKSRQLGQTKQSWKKSLGKRSDRVPEPQRSVGWRKKLPEGPLFLSVMYDETKLFNLVITRPEKRVYQSPGVLKVLFLLQGEVSAWSLYHKSWIDGVLH